MAKQENDTIKKDEIKESIEKLKKQQDDSKDVWTKCQGAIEVLEQLLQGKKDE